MLIPEFVEFQNLQLKYQDLSAGVNHPLIMITKLQHQPTVNLAHLRYKRSYEQLFYGHSVQTQFLKFISVLRSRNYLRPVAGNKF